MLDIGWTELLVVAVVLIVVVGPKELPHLLRTFGKTMTKLRRMATDFRSQVDEALKEADMDDVSSAVHDVRKLNPANQLRDAINPLRETARDLQSDLKKSTSLDNKPSSGSGAPDLPRQSYPAPGEAPDLSGADIFRQAQGRSEEDADMLVSKPKDGRLVSRRKSFKPAPRPVKPSAGKGSSRRRKNA